MAKSARPLVYYLGRVSVTDLNYASKRYASTSAYIKPDLKRKFHIL